MTTDLVPLPEGLCPACGAEALTSGWAQLPLLRHAGYGAAVEVKSRYCPSCPWSLTTTITEIRP